MKAVVVYEGGVPIWSKRTFAGNVPGIADASEDSDYVNFRVGSGWYDFRLEQGDSE